MWDLIVSVPNHCLSFYFVFLFICISVLCGEGWGAGESRTEKELLIKCNQILKRIPEQVMRLE